MIRSFDCRDPQVRRRGLDSAAAALQRRRLVVAPLDTGYGLLADAFSPEAMAALRAARSAWHRASTRSRSQSSVPVLVARTTAVSGIARADERAVDLMRAFWPGPLTLVLPAQPSVAWDVPDDHGRVAVRMPLHPLALEVLERTGPLGALAAPEVVTRGAGEDGAEAMAEALGAAVLLFSDPLPEGPLSTVIDLSGVAPILVRPGQYSLELLREVCPDLQASDEPVSRRGEAP